MNFFEFDDNGFIKNELNLDNRNEKTLLLLFNEYSNCNDCKNVNVECADGEVTCRQYECASNQWLLICMHPTKISDETVLKGYKRNNEEWQHTLNVSLTQLLQVECVRVTSVTFYHFYALSNILMVVLRSEQMLHVVRIDVSNSRVTDMLSFPLTSVYNTSSDCVPATIVNSDKTIVTILLVDESTNRSIQYCPRVTELLSLLTRRLLVGIQSLLSFWTSQLTLVVVTSSTDSLIAGIPRSQFVTFLRTHHTVLLDLMALHCRGYNPSTSLFIEQIATMVNDYLNETITLLISQSTDINNGGGGGGGGGLDKLLTMLCEQAHTYRELVLVSRTTLNVYQRLAFNKVVKKRSNEEKLHCYYGVENLQAIDKDSVVSSCLIRREIAALQNYTMTHCGGAGSSNGITEDELRREAYNVILCEIEDCSWSDLQDLVTTLGEEPITTLTTLCHETKDKAIRNYLYNHLDLDRCDVLNKYVKNVVDQLELAYSIKVIEISNSSFHLLLFGNDKTLHSTHSDNHIQPFIDRFDKSKCRSLRRALINDKCESLKGNLYQLININLNLFLGLLKSSSDGDLRQNVSDGVELCLIDADYRRLLMETEYGQGITTARLSAWIYKSRKNVVLFVRYVTESCNIDLIKAVIDIDFSTDLIIGRKLIDHFILMVSDSSDIQYTDIDRSIGKEALFHILVQYPEFLMSKLDELYSTDITKANYILSMISERLPLHLLCQNHICPLKKTTIKESPLLVHINKVFLERIIANSWDSEFPIVFYYLLRDNRFIPNLNTVNDHPSTRKAALLHCAVTNMTGVDTFNCLISRDIETIGYEDKLSLAELDEIAYAALLSGISYNDIADSSNPIVTKIRSILVGANYWDLLKKRLLRPLDNDNRSGNIEQYYEVNMYNFLHRSGIPLSLDSIFVDQQHNNFSKKGNVNNPLSVPIIVDRKISISSEQSKESLGYIYYLSLGRPYQAFYSIEKEFTIANKPGCVSFDTMKDIVKSIYQIALSNIDDRLIIGGCFGLLRLIGYSAELLRCYLTLIQWIIDWHVQTNDQFDLSDSMPMQLTPSDIRRHYSIKIMALFKFCLSKNSSERKNSRDLLIRQLEEIFIWRLKHGYYKEIKDILVAWGLVLYFCQMHGAQFTTAILQYYATNNQWLLFLCIAQVFGYTKDQVKETINQFEEGSIRQHMSYIVSKADDLSHKSFSSAQTEDFSHPTKTTTDPLNRLKRTLTVGPVEVTMTGPGQGEHINTNESLPIKEVSFSKQKSRNKYILKALVNSAKPSLFELIFDCQVNSSNISELTEDKKRSTNIRLSVRKLLAYCLALGHPFLSVLAYSSEVYKDDISDSSNDNKWTVYRNCLACFIISSSPKKIQENIWTKWCGVAKLDWSEDEIIDLTVFAIENGFVKVVSKAFTVLKPDQFPCVAAFFAMISHAMECYNSVLRDLFLVEFVNECTLMCNSTFVSTKDRYRSKSSNNSMLVFVNRLLGTSLLIALQVAESNLGQRILQEWLISLLSSTTGLMQSYVTKLFPFTDTNLLLLSNVLSVHFDFIDLEATSQLETQFKNICIPVNTKSKEFMQFVESLIISVLSKLGSCYDYTRFMLAVHSLALVDLINSLHSVQPPSNREKWKTDEKQLKTLSTLKADPDILCSQTVIDLVSMALAGQSDKLDAVSMCTHDDSSFESLIEKECSFVNGISETSYGSSDSWRRLVIPEEWQDKILSLPNATGERNLERISHVSCLLNESKWIEACNYMIEHEFVVKDAILILTAMKVASGKMDLSKLPTFLKEYCQLKPSDSMTNDSVNRLPVRRMSIIMNNSATKLSLMHSIDNDLNGSKNPRQSRSADSSQQFITKITEVLIHGQELVEYICTIHCVATKMAESYMSVASGDEFDVLTKILVGTCRDKIDTADMYLGVVDIDPEQLCNFVAKIIVHVLRLEIQTLIGSTSVMNTTPYLTSISTSPKRSKNFAKTPSFSVSPSGLGSPKSSMSSSPTCFSRRSGHTVTSHNSALSLHENTLKVAERCQLRSEWRTVATTKTKPESRLIKAFTLQDILILSPNPRKLGKILFYDYQRFSQEVSDCNEDAEFLVHLLIQCHNCFTDGGDTIGISNCLKAAKELTRLLNTNGYFALMAQLLCRIGRYGEMPYIFSNLIENHQFEQLFRKGMDKDGVIVPYIFDYLNRYHNDDYDKIEMVCLKYNCHYELAETKSKMATLSIRKLKAHLGPNCVKETAKMLTTSIINCLLDACKNYLKAGCYKKMDEHFRKAQFYKLQQRWLEDPDKTFSAGPLNRAGKLLAGKVILPETGLTYGVNIITFNSEQALAFLKKIPNFYTAYIISDQFKLSHDAWIELLVHHVLLNGEETYLQHYISYLGPVLSCNLVQQCLNRWDKFSSTKLTNKHGLKNLKVMLSHCGDVFFINRISDTYKLDN